MSRYKKHLRDKMISVRLTADELKLIDKVCADITKAQYYTYSRSDLLVAAARKASEGNTGL